MTNARFPRANSEWVDANRYPTPPFYNWAASVNTALSQGSLSGTATADALATLTTSFNTLNNSKTSVRGVPPIYVSGSFASGGFLIRLAPSAFDSGILVNQVFGG